MISSRRDGIALAHSYRVLHLDIGGPDTPRLPRRRVGALGQIAASALAHAAGALAVVYVLDFPRAGTDPSLVPSIAEQPCVDVSHIVFVAADPRLPGAGGGGGGNRSKEPIRRAEGKGRDAATLRVTKRPAVAGAARVPPVLPDDVPLPSIVIDAKPLASGSLEQLGLPSTGVTAGVSLGPGSGGGVGTGQGTGLGAGQGPGIGRGSGGGTGGGVFRPGGRVTAPRLIAEVRPKYTNGALLQKIQGTVELELVVTREGRPSQIRIVRSLDPGLDDEAIAAVTLWRFEPGRYAGAPVDVLVTVLLDFSIR